MDEPRRIAATGDGKGKVCEEEQSCKGQHEEMKITVERHFASSTGRFAGLPAVRDITS